METEKNQTCCFIGPRVMLTTEKLSEKLHDTIEKLIIENDVNTFLFSGKAKFDNFCFYIVSDLKQKYPHIRRIKTRTGFAGFDDVNDYILDDYYDDAYCSGRILNANGTIYQGKTEKERIDMSGFCITYHDEDTDDLEELLYDSVELHTKSMITYAESAGISIISIGK